MAEILCIVCNRMNEAGAERCWFCGAVLPSADWRLHPEDEEKKEQQSDTPQAAAEEAVPEWLSRIRTRQRLERGENLEEPFTTEREEPQAELEIGEVEPGSEPVTVGIPDEVPLLESDHASDPPGLTADNFPQESLEELTDATGLETEDDNHTLESADLNPEIQDNVIPQKETEGFSPDGMPSWHAFLGTPAAGFSEDDISEPGEPQGRRQDLVVTPLERESAELFRLLQESPRNNLRVSGEKQRVGKWLPYLLLSVVLLLAILVPRLFPASAVFSSTLFPREVVALYQVINSLPQDKPVLIAADYEAAGAGEMNWVSRYLLLDLMTGKIPMVTLSTNVVGTAILRENLRTTAIDAAEYDLGTMVLDLGYLPGNSIGLKAMAEDWRGTMPYTADFQLSWKQPLLLKIGKLSDFGAVLVLTENPETARDWVEQVKPALGETPLLLVLNARTAPLVQPYYDSGQVDGYVSGLSGALAYSQLEQQGPVNSSSYLSLQVALLAIVFIILLGGLGHFALTSPSRSKNGVPS